jgi:glycosyltransferase involved in cell wall biosynthesis
MKVAHLIGSLNRGGTETLLLDLVSTNEAGCDLEFMVIHRKGGSLQQNFKEIGVNIHELPSTGNKFVYLKRLRKLLIERKIEIVHAHQSLDAFYAFWACIGLDIKIAQSFHGYDYSNRRVSSMITNFIIHKTDVNIFVSHHVKKYYMEEYQLKGYNIVLYNGIGIRKVDSLVTDSLRVDFKINDESLVLGTVGNFVAVRDPLTICKFLNLLKKKGVQFHFFFVGAKNDKEPYLFDVCHQYCLEKGLAPNVSFLGSRNDVPSILKQLDAFIYSTDHDTFGIAMVEAMMAGIPTFVNDWEVMNEITENGTFATIYKTKNEQDLLLKFEDFQANTDRYKQISKIKSAVVKEKYSIGNHLAGLHSIYNALKKIND